MVSLGCKDIKDVSQLTIPPALVSSCKGARMRYGLYLEDQQKLNKLTKEETSKKRLREEISEGEFNVGRMQKNIEKLRKVSYI